MVAVSLASGEDLEVPQLLCTKPYMVHGRLPTRCGQCHCCRVAAKRAVVLRAMLERQQHEHACCATLTYSDEFVGDYQVRPSDWVHARDRLRYHVRQELGVPLRFFGIGEYGEEKGRPHWHVVAFGLPKSVGQEFWEQAWTDPQFKVPMGNVKVDVAGLAAMEYCAGYCMKKMTSPGDPWLEGRAPEFVIRPNRPGLGLGFAGEIAESILSDAAALAVVKQVGDIPSQLRVGRGLQGLDKLLRNKVRDLVFDEAAADQAREARKANFFAECALGKEQMGAAWQAGAGSSAEVRVVQREKRSKIFASRRTL